MTTRTVLCFGDSNTHGTVAMRHEADRRRHPYHQRWTTVMADELGDGWQVIPEGHPGRTAVFDDPIEGPHKNGSRVLQAILESHRPIDLVILMLGTNDFKARFNMSAYDVASGLQRLIVAIKGSDSGPNGSAPKVLLAAPATLLETGIGKEMVAGATAKSEVLPEYLQRVAASQQTGFINVSEVAKVDPVDGIHLDVAAHRTIGQAMATAVRNGFK